jgi:hypothetical protein
MGEVTWCRGILRFAGFWVLSRYPVSAKNECSDAFSVVTNEVGRRECPPCVALALGEFESRHSLHIFLYVVSSVVYCSAVFSYTYNSQPCSVAVEDLASSRDLTAASQGHGILGMTSNGMG